MKVLIPLDGSELAESTFPWVRLLAQKEELQVTLVRSYFPALPIHVMPELTLPPMESVSGEAVERLEEYLENAAARLALESVSHQCVVGDAAEVILNQAESHDLVVMGSHGRGGLGRWLLGSTTTKVVRGSETPILVVGARADVPVKLERILVPLDGSETAEAALETAKNLARSHSAELVLMRALMTARPELSGSAIFEAKRQEMEEAQEYLGALKEKLYSYQTEVLVAEQAPVPGILWAAQEMHADLIAIGSHGRSGAERWLLGSVAEAVLQKSHCPVLVARNV